MGKWYYIKQSGDVVEISDEYFVKFNDTKFNSVRDINEVLLYEFDYSNNPQASRGVEGIKKRFVRALEKLTKAEGNEVTERLKKVYKLPVGREPIYMFKCFDECYVDDRGHERVWLNGNNLDQLKEAMYNVFVDIDEVARLVSDSSLDRMIEYRKIVRLLNKLRPGLNVEVKEKDTYFSPIDDETDMREKELIDRVCQSYIKNLPAVSVAASERVKDFLKEWEKIDKKYCEVVMPDIMAELQEVLDKWEWIRKYIKYDLKDIELPENIRIEIAQREYKKGHISLAVNSEYMYSDLIRDNMWPRCCIKHGEKK